MNAKMGFHSAKFTPTVALCTQTDFKTYQLL